MRFVVCAVIAVATLVLPCGIALGATPAPSTAQLKAWLAQLDDENYARREEAGRQLLAAGVSAIDVLADGVLSPSPEAAWRAGETLKQIAIQGSEQELDRVAAALERLESSGKTGMKKVALEIRQRQRQVRHDRAAAQIQKLGGRLVGGGEASFEEFAAAPLIMAAPAIAVAVEAAPVEIKVEVKPADAPAEDVPADEAQARAAAKAEVEAALAELLKDKEAAKDLGQADPEKFREVVKDLFGGGERRPPAPEPAAKERGPAPPAKEAPPAGFEGDLSLIIGGGLEVVPEPAPAAAPGEAAPVDIPLVEADLVAADAFFMIDPAGEEFSLNEGQTMESLALDSSWQGGDQGLRVLRDLPNVTSVEIRGAKLTDESLSYLAGLPRLERIQIQGTKFSSQALHKLRRARPSATIFCRGDAMLGVHCDTSGDCVLTSVYYGSGAFEAGLQDGDKILAVDGLEVADFSDLTIAVYPHVAGDKIKIEFQRGAERKTATVTLKSRNVLEKRSE